MYVVVLQAMFHGSSACSTEDVIAASSPQEAEQKAIREWVAAEPTFSFDPLITTVEADDAT